MSFRGTFAKLLAAGTQADRLAARPVSIRNVKLLRMSTLQRSEANEQRPRLERHTVDFIVPSEEKTKMKTSQLGFQMCDQFFHTRQARREHLEELFLRDGRLTFAATLNLDQLSG